MSQATFRCPVLIGMVHLLPTPGSPRFAGSFDAVIERAILDARTLAENGCDALLVENFGDAPFLAEQVGPETIASLTAAVQAITAATRGARIGVNVLRNDARGAIGIAAATGASFVRVNVHVGVRATDQGILQGRAWETLRERARLCPGTAILADVAVKHSAPIGERPLAEEVSDLVHRGLADAVIVTGPATGSAPSIDRVRAVREASDGRPVLVGSGVDVENARALLQVADGAIVGSSIKIDGRTAERVDAARVQRLAEVVRTARRAHP